MSVDINRAVSVKQQNLAHLIKRRNVVGVGVGFKESEGVVTDELVVTINVAKKVPVAQLAESDKVPRDLEGVKTDVVETGRFLAGEAAAQAQTTKDRWRQRIPAGVSIGHVDVTAGTFGCLVRRGTEIFILSNNHVLANVNSGQPGDAIIQPGRYDGGTPADKVAVLAEYIPLDFGGDAASCNIATGVEKALNWVADLIFQLPASGLDLVLWVDSDAPTPPPAAPPSSGRSRSCPESRPRSRAAGARAARPTERRRARNSPAASAGF